MEELIKKAQILMEALPYIQKFRGKRIVVKYGGHAMVDESLKESFARDIIMMRLIGLLPIVVHGGGPQIGQVLEKMGIQSRFHDGMRITDENTMDVVEMVLVGKVNKEIVGFVNRYGGRAIGLSGKDGSLIMAQKIPPMKIKITKRTTELIDLGRVGEVTQINPQVLTRMEDDLFIPVVAPVGVDESGVSLNINADNVAAAIAAAVQAEKLILLTDVQGVLDAEGKLLSQLDARQIDDLIGRKVLTGGMIPKVKCCLEAIQNGVGRAHVIDGRLQHAVLLEIFTDSGVGTLIQ